MSHDTGVDTRHADHATTANNFDATWEDDGSAFEPNNIPLKRIARAWERKPRSPFARRGGTGKIWSRVTMPRFNTARDDETDFAKSINFAAPEQRTTIQSPKKAVKKLCLKTPFGQDWRTTEWESSRGSHARKLAPRAPIVLRSGAVIDPNIDNEDDDQVPDEDEDEEIAGTSDGSGTNTATDTAAQNQDSEWEDVDSDHELEDSCADGTHVVFPTDGARQAPDVALHASEGDGEAELDTLTAQVANLDDAHRSSHEILAEQNAEEDMQITSKDADSDAQADAETWAVNDEAAPTQAIPAIKEPDDFAEAAEATNLASPQETETMQSDTQTSTRTRPRHSADDTAFLTAFLSRQAANKKPSPARRESLTNRRHSGLIRQALSSPAKTDVLAELDANSPSPHKAARSELAPTVEGRPKKARSPEKELPTHDSEENRPTRRSGRSRARPNLLLNQMTAEAPQKPPSKITIRAATEQVSLKKNETQELSAQTRANTRKNKGGSIMPLERLSKLAAAADSQDPCSDEIPDSQATTKANNKNVRWDETLVYFSKSPDEPALEEAKALQAPQMPTSLPIEDPPLSPTKARSKRGKAGQNGSPKKAEFAQHEPAAGPNSEETPAPKPRPAQTKRRSRIATPAKGLLSKASLLPDDVTQTTETEEPTKATAPIQTETKKQPTPRGLPTPKRTTPAANLTTALKQCQEQQENPSPRKSSIPSITTFAPRLNPQSSELPKLSFEEALSAPQMTTRRTARTADGNGGSGILPGLRSPAKKRRRAPAAVAVAGEGVGVKRENSAEMMGLSSPAKRRSRAV